MHYVGMAAIEISPPIQYRAGWVTVSFAVAIAASFVALVIAFSTREGRWRRHRAAAGACVMGVAIAGMHYVGMFAAQFPRGAQSAASAVVNKGWLAGSVTMMTLFVLFATLLLLYVESRAAARAARMQASLAEAEETSRAKDEFLAMLGHELRNPLASISNAAHLLGRAPAHGAEWQFAQEVIARQATHLSHIVEDLLDVGRAISGKMSLALEPLDLHLAVEQALQSLRASGKTADRRVECLGGSAWVEADRTRIEQAVSNLVSNAVRHTQPRGRIGLRVFSWDGQAILTVSDDGAGMDAETAARAFELFYQAHQDPDRKQGGLGIGLTLVRRIAELHGGTASGASEGRGQGSTFTLRIPLIAPPRAARSGDALAGAPSGRQVVIVEDSSDTRLSLQKILEHEGHTVHTAADGPSGLAAILHHEPDIALVDIGLPGLDGYRLAERLRYAGIRTYLVALTGYGLAQDKQRAREAGFDAHLTKPAAMEELIRLVSDAKPAA
jgi:signal transduction histidine kinase